MSESPRVMSRRELFDMVWAKPAPEAAAELGISESGLRRICSRHRVPCPSSAYWERVAGGQSFKLPPFRKIHDPALERVEVTAQLRAAPVLVIEPPNPATTAQAPRSELPVAAPEVPSPDVDKPHASISATAKALRQARADENGCVSATGPGLCGVILHRDRAERALTFLYRLAAALEAEGLTLQPDDRRMKITVDQDTITFTLTEKTRREKHIPTAAEQDLHARRQARRRAAADRGDWDLHSSIPYVRPWSEYDTIHTGQLAFLIEGWSHGLRKTWADGKTQRIDTLVDAIVAGLKATLAY